MLFATSSQKPLIEVIFDYYNQNQNYNNTHGIYTQGCYGKKEESIADYNVYCGFTKVKFIT